MTATKFDINWIHDLMRELGKPGRRPVFHSEADFQHELAWQLYKKGHAVRLEYPYPHNQVKASSRLSPEQSKVQENNKREYMDIWLPNERIAIELKYRKAKVKKAKVGGEIEWMGETFLMKNQSAADIGRYNFLADLGRLERFSQWEIGYAILLTNDPSYWNEPRNEGNIDECFQLHEGRGEIKGKLKWKRDTGTGAGRSPIGLSSSYLPKWKCYSKFDVEKNGKFQYLAFQVLKPATNGGKQ